MTDEEKAEKYLIRFWQKNNIVDILPIKTAWDLRCLFIDVIKYVLTEGKPKWHDLRKDPNDLPKENGEYYGKVNYFGEQYRNIFFVVDRKSFDVDCVLAWCELPKFEEQI